jgi:hypothetical protein
MLLCGIAFAGYSAWYTYERSQIIKGDLACAHPMRSPSGDMVCVQDIIPPTFVEKVFNLPPKLPTELSIIATTSPGAAPQGDHSPVIDILAATTVRPELVPLMEKTGKIDDHVTLNPTLEEVTVCGTSFMARKLTYDGIDVLKALAAMLPATSTYPAQTLQEGTCFNMPYEYGNLFAGQYRIAELPVFDVRTYDDTASGDTKYSFGISQQYFSLDGATGDLYAVGGYDGSLSLLGKVK